MNGTAPHLEANGVDSVLVINIQHAKESTWCIEIELHEMEDA